MAISERLALLVTLDAKGAIKSFNDLGKAADKNLGKADDRLDRMSSGFQKAGAGMLATAGLLGAGLYKAGQAAGDLEQAVGGTEAVFGEASSAIDEFAKKAAQSAGLSESAFRSATTSIGGQLKGLGFTVGEAADQAVQLTQVAADLSATYGGTTAEAVAALGAAFRGEADPAERFNLFLNQTRVNAKAVELGLAATTSSVDAHAKAQATLALITEQSKDAQGQFAREADTAQGAMARFSASAENLKASLGGAVAPVMAEVADSLGGVIQKFNDLSPATQRGISRFALLSTGALGAAGALSFTAGKVLDMRTNLSGLTDKLRGAEGGLNRWGKALSGLAIAGTVVGLVSVAREMNKLTFDVDKLTAALGDLDRANGEKLESFVRASLAFDTFDDVMQQFAETNVAAAQDMLDFAAANGLAAEDVKKYQKVIDEQTKSQALNAISQSEGSAAIDETVESMGGLAGASGEAETAIAGVTEKVDIQKESLDKATESMNLFQQGIEEAFGDLTLEEAADRRAQAFSDMAQRFADAQDAVKTAKQRVSDLLATPVEDRTDTFGRDLASAQQDVQDAIDETSRALEGNSEAALQNREDLRGVVDRIAGVIEAHRTEKASLEDLQIIRQMEKDNLVSQLEQLGFNREEIGRYIEAIDAIPLTAETTVTVETATAEAKLNAWIERMNREIELNPISVDVLQSEKFASGPRSLPGRAIGGPVTAGQMYSTNEYLGAGKGFEWFAPANGTISPAGSGPSGTVVEQNVTIINPIPEPVSSSARSLRRVAMDVAS